MINLEEIYQILSSVASDIRESGVGNIQSAITELDTQADRVTEVNQDISSTLTEQAGAISGAKDSLEEVIGRLEAAASELEDWRFGA